MKLIAQLIRLSTQFPLTCGCSSRRRSRKEREPRHQKPGAPISSGLELSSQGHKIATAHTRQQSTSSAKWLKNRACTHRKRRRRPSVPPRLRQRVDREDSALEASDFAVTSCFCQASRNPGPLIAPTQNLTEFETLKKGRSTKRPPMETASVSHQWLSTATLVVVQLCAYLGHLDFATTQLHFSPHPATLISNLRSPSLRCCTVTERVPFLRRVRLVVSRDSLPPFLAVVMPTNGLNHGPTSTRTTRTPPQRHLVPCLVTHAPSALSSVSI